jgi:hypothetical protein
VDGYADLPATPPATLPTTLPATLLSTMESSFGMLTFVRPPGRIDGAAPSWSSPPPQQGEHPATWW